MAATVHPAAVGAPGAPVSSTVTATLVAAISKAPDPPPKANPSSEARASGATSIITSAGTLRTVLRRSFQAIAKTFMAPRSIIPSARGR